MGKRRAMAGSSNLFVQLARTLDCLPSAEERDRLLAGFAVIRALVERLEQSFQVLPSQTDAAQARRAVEDIRAFMEKLDSDPVLRAALGVGERIPTGSRPRAPRSSEEVGADVATAIDALSMMPVDDARTELAGDRYSIAAIRRIAAVLGIRGASRLTREALVHQIAMKLANYRGYKRLGGEAEAP